MSRRRLISFPVLLLLACATAVSAKDDSDSRRLARVPSQGLDQVVYKGIVGNVLDTIPMDPARRVDLQRTNAVVSSALSGRSLAVLAGWSNPVLLLGGLVWGVWAASNIEPEEAGLKATTDADNRRGGAATEQALVALMYRSTAEKDARATSSPEPVTVGSIAAAGSDAESLPRNQVIKVWLPQRSGSLPR